MRVLHALGGDGTFVARDGVLGVLGVLGVWARTREAYVAMW